MADDSNQQWVPIVGVAASLAVLGTVAISDRIQTGAAEIPLSLTAIATIVACLTVMVPRQRTTLRRALLYLVGIGICVVGGLTLLLAASVGEFDTKFGQLWLWGCALALIGLAIALVAATRT